MRKPIIAGNWKMYKDVHEAKSFVNNLKSYPLPKNVDAVICAPFISLSTLVAHTKGIRLGIGAQNVHWEREGAYTGEVSVPMLQKLDVNYVIIGHSERRQYFAETDEMVHLKTKAALDGGLTPIVCVGEQLEHREEGNTAAVIQKQIQQGLFGLSSAEMKQLVIAYEPVWAIGTGKASTASDAQEVCQLIRQTVVALWSMEVGEAVRIQYGGSVKPSNIATYLSQPDIDGALVGGASLQPDSFLALLTNAHGDPK